ncbi:MAG: hypothetical protein AB1Z65_15100 [Candidatus Sulfomarinibacteraceae bacterium]
MLGSIRRSRRTQLLLIVLAALLSLLPLTAKSRQGNSIRWSVDGDRVTVEYFQVPAFSHVREYQLDKIDGVTKAPDSRNPSLDVVRLNLNGLNLNIPSQSSRLIWNFDLYLSRLEGFIDKAKDGDEQARLTWYDPWLVIGAVSLVLAAALWILVFTILLQGPPETDSGAQITRP